MAIVRSQDGHFFEVPDEQLKQYEMKQDDIPESAKGSPGLSQGSGMVGPGQGVSPVQIIVNYVQPGQMGRPSGGENAPEGAAAGQKQGQDVGGRYCGHWHNCWRNCWRNSWRNFSW
jgi:hypothetical protein